MVRSYVVKGPQKPGKVSHKTWGICERESFYFRREEPSFISLLAVPPFSGKL